MQHRSRRCRPSMKPRVWWWVPVTSATGRKRQSRSSKPPSAIWWVRSLSYLELWQRKYREGRERDRRRNGEREGGREEGRERKVLDGQFNYHKSFKGWTRPMKKHKYHQERRWLVKLNTPLTITSRIHLPQMWVCLQILLSSIPTYLPTSLPPPT